MMCENYEPLPIYRQPWNEAKVDLALLCDNRQPEMILHASSSCPFNQQTAVGILLVSPTQNSSSYLYRVSFTYPTVIFDVDTSSLLN